MCNFSLEKEMTPIVETWLEDFFHVVHRELKCGYVGRYTPDLVAANFDHLRLKMRKRTTPMPRRRIEKLIGGNRTPPIYHTDLVAVELKLKNFPQAYFQAKIYQSYGMRSYIAMPIKVAVNLDWIRREVMRYDGIGLIGVSDKCKVLDVAVMPVKFELLEQIQIAERMIPKK